MQKVTIICDYCRRNLTDTGEAKFKTFIPCTGEKDAFYLDLCASCLAVLAETYLQEWIKVRGRLPFEIPTEED